MTFNNSLTNFKLTTMKKLIKLAAWLSGTVGALLMLLGIIARLAGGVLFNHYWANYFYSAETFLLLGIFLFVGVRLWDSNQ